MRFYAGSVIPEGKYDHLLVPMARGVAAAWMRIHPTDCYEDVYSDAMFGMVQALRTWRPGGTAFESFAYWKARCAVIDGYRNERAPMPRLRWAKVKSQGDGDFDLDDLPEHLKLPLSIQSQVRLDDHEAEGQYEDTTGFEAYEQADNKVLVAKMMESLSPRLRMVIECHDLLGFTMARVAEALGVTESRVSQMHKQAIEIMREKAA